MSAGQPSAGRVSVVMVTYNSSGVVLDALRPLLADDRIEVVVVDNASVDGTADLVESLRPAPTVVRGTENVGFARAVNRGAALTSGDVLVLVNPDAVVTPATLHHLARTLQDERVGVVGPEIVHPTGRLRILSAGRFPTTWRMFTHYAGLSRFGGGASALEGHYLLASTARSGRVDVDWVTGACLALRRPLWQRLGGLTEQWFMYAEDVELCHRVRELGLAVQLDMDVSATHLVGASDGERGTRVSSAWVLHLYDFYRQDLSRGPASAVLWRAVVAGGLVSRAAAYRLAALRSRDASSPWAAESRRFLTHARDVVTLPHLPRAGRRAPSRSRSQHR